MDAQSSLLLRNASQTGGRGDLKLFLASYFQIAGGKYSCTLVALKAAVNGRLRASLNMMTGGV